MKIIGLTGGIASGKTTVARMLADLGAVVLSADAVAKDAVQLGKPAWDEIVEYFGEGILLPNNELDRKKLAKIIFNNPDKRKALEEIVHPRVIQEFTEIIEQYKKHHKSSILVLDVPLLFETNMDSAVDQVWLVKVEPETQIKRLLERNQLSREEAMARINAQLPLEQKIQKADVVIDADVPLEHLQEQIKELWSKLSV